MPLTSQKAKSHKNWSLPTGQGWPWMERALRGLIPAGLGMMGVPGGPPPPGGPCGKKVSVRCANMSTAHLSMFANTSPNSQPPNPAQSPPTALIPPKPHKLLTKGQTAGAGGLTTYVPGDEEEYGICRDERDRFSHGLGNPLPLAGLS